uniref:Uncharacterized protein n=1 Tax=Arundo donax TaxID=35708 RepID=A0A0A9DUB5_ARUDO
MLRFKRTPKSTWKDWLLKEKTRMNWIQYSFRQSCTMYMNHFEPSNQKSVYINSFDRITCRPKDFI